MQFLTNLVLRRNEWNQSGNQVIPFTPYPSKHFLIAIWTLRTHALYPS